MATVTNTPTSTATVTPAKTRSRTRTRTRTPVTTPAPPTDEVHDAAVYFKMTANGSVASALVRDNAGLEVGNVVARLYELHSGVDESFRSTVRSLITRQILKVEWLYPSTLYIPCRHEVWSPSYVASDICTSIFNQIKSEVSNPDCPSFEQAPVWFHCNELHLSLLQATASVNISIDDAQVIYLPPPSRPAYPAAFDLVRDVFPISPPALTLEAKDVWWTMWVPTTHKFVVGEIGLILREDSRSPPDLLSERPMQLSLASGSGGREVVDPTRSGQGVTATVISEGRWVFVNVTVLGSVFNAVNPPDSREVAAYVQAVLRSDHYRKAPSSAHPLSFALLDTEPPTEEQATTITLVPAAAFTALPAAAGGGIPVWLITLIALAFLVVLAGIVVLGLIFCYQQRSRVAHAEDDEEEDDFTGELLTTIFVRACGDWSEEAEKELHVEVLSDMTVRNVINRCLKFFELERPCFLFTLDGTHLHADTMLHNCAPSTLLFVGRKFIKSDEGDVQVTDVEADV